MENSLGRQRKSEETVRDDTHVMFQSYIAAAKVMQDGLNHYKTLQNDPERWTDLARVHFLLDTVMPPSDKHLHIGLDCVQSAVKLAGEESELAGDAWMMAAQAATSEYESNRRIQSI